MRTASRWSGFTWIAPPAMMVIIASLPLCVPSVRGAETPPVTSRQPRVLVLYSNERLLPANMVVDEAIRTTFNSELEVPVEFYSEFMDVDRFPREAQQERLRDYLRDRFRERPPDVVIAGGGAALNFLIRHRPTMFPRVPVVHCGAEPKEIPESWPDDLMVGIPQTVDGAKTLELALRLQPDTRQVAIVDGINSGGLAPADVSSLATRIEFLWLTNRSIAELREELALLPNHTVVFYGTMFRDPAGNAFTPQAALDRFAPACRVPIYGYYDTYLGHGIVGGSIVTFATIGRTAAEIAIRILQGQKPQDAVRGMRHTPTPMFDWQQLQRWRISESRLPPDAEIRFRQPTVWEEHRRLIVGAFALCSVEAALIAGLVLQLHRRRRAEAQARELSGRLIHTQEEERSRIARDLHDDFNQRLALLSVEIDLLRRTASTQDSAAKLQQLGDHTRELASDLHRLAYQLHPAKLDQLGLMAAVNGLGRDVSQKSGLKVHFTHDKIPRDLPAEVARCVFRVVQEALQNIVRHSGAMEAQVGLAVQNGQLRLVVADAGRGFELKAAGRSAGLGLLSMRERVRLSQGQLQIQSELGRGTRVELTIPLRKVDTTE